MYAICIDGIILGALLIVDYVLLGTFLGLVIISIKYKKRWILASTLFIEFLPMSFHLIRGLTEGTIGDWALFFILLIDMFFNLIVLAKD